MTKRVFIVHGWEATPESDWFPWLKSELEKRRFEAIVPEMPDTVHPRIGSWVSTLSNTVGKPDDETILVGHSIGGQTVLRYLSTIEGDRKVRGTVIVASWTTLRSAALGDKESRDVANPWLTTPIDWDKAKEHSKQFTAIFSDNDPYVDLDVNEEFKSKLGAKIIVEHGKGHMNTEAGITELPSVLEEIILMAKASL